jgi:hypothetical protein
MRGAGSEGGVGNVRGVQWVRWWTIAGLTGAVGLGVQGAGAREEEPLAPGVDAGPRGQLHLHLHPQSQPPGGVEFPMVTVMVKDGVQCNCGSCRQVRVTANVRGSGVWPVGCCPLLWLASDGGSARLLCRRCLVRRISRESVVRRGGCGVRVASVIVLRGRRDCQASRDRWQSSVGGNAGGRGGEGHQHTSS